MRGVASLPIIEQGTPNPGSKVAIRVTTSLTGKQIGSYPTPVYFVSQAEINQGDYAMGTNEPISVILAAGPNVKMNRFAIPVFLVQ